MAAKERYDEVFAIEVEGWCHGIAQYPGEISYALVFSVIRELSPSFKRAVASHVVIDIPDIAARMSKSAKYLVDERLLAFDIMMHLPHPNTVDQDTLRVLVEIIGKTEQGYAGARAFIEKKWGLPDGALALEPS